MFSGQLTIILQMTTLSSCRVIKPTVKDSVMVLPDDNIPMLPSSQKMAFGVHYQLAG
jgi:hypothetical protein